MTTRALVLIERTDAVLGTSIPSQYAGRFASRVSLVFDKTMISVGCTWLKARDTWEALARGGVQAVQNPNSDDFKVERFGYHMKLSNVSPPEFGKV